MTLARLKSVFECIHKHIKIQNIAGTIFLVSCISFAFDAYPYVHDIIIPLIIFFGAVCTTLFAVLFYKTGVVDNPKENKFVSGLAFMEFYSCVVLFVCVLVALLNFRAGDPTEKTATIISDRIIQNIKPHQEDAPTFNYTGPEPDLNKLVLGNNDLTLEEATAYLEHYNFKSPPYSFEGEDGKTGASAMDELAEERDPENARGITVASNIVVKDSNVETSIDDIHPLKGGRFYRTKTLNSMLPRYELPESLEPFEPQDDFTAESTLAISYEQA